MWGIYYLELALMQSVSESLHQDGLDNEEQLYSIVYNDEIVQSNLNKKFLLKSDYFKTVIESDPSTRYIYIYSHSINREILDQIILYLKGEEINLDVFDSSSIERVCFICNGADYMGIDELKNECLTNLCNYLGSN